MADVILLYLSSMQMKSITLLQMRSERKCSLYECMPYANISNWICSPCRFYKSNCSHSSVSLCVQKWSGTDNKKGKKKAMNWSLLQHIILCKGGVLGNIC